MRLSGWGRYPTILASAYITQRAIPARTLDDLLALIAARSAATYSVAWLDGLAADANLGRGLLLLGEHAPNGGLAPRLARQVTIPIDLPSLAINRWSVASCNYLYAQAKTRGTKDARMSAAVFRHGYPHAERFAALRACLGLRDTFSSSQARRLEL